VRVSNLGQDAEEPQIVIDAAGETIAVWERRRKEHRSVIQSPSRPAGGDWSAPTTISSFGSFEPQVAVNANGEAVAVWRHRAGHKIVVQGASRSSGGDWSAPTTLSRGRGEFFEPKVAIDDAGEAIAAWEVSFRDDSSVVQSASRSLLGTWSKPTNAFPRVPTRDSGGTQVAIAATGEAIAVWGYFDPKFIGIVQSASRPAGGTWSRPIELSRMPEALAVPEPEIAFNAAGEVVAVWEREEDISTDISIQSASHPPGGAWSRPVSVYKGHTEAEYVFPEIAVSNAGEAVAVWEGYGAGSALIQSASRPPGGAWSQPVGVFGGSDQAAYHEAGENPPYVAINASGDAVAVWQGPFKGIRAASRSPDGLWSPSSKLSRERVPYDYNPHIAISPTGEAVALWEHLTGGHALIQSSSRLPGWS